MRVDWGRCVVVILFCRSKDEKKEKEKVIWREGKGVVFTSVKVVFDAAR